MIQENENKKLVNEIQAEIRASLDTQVGRGFVNMLKHISELMFSKSTSFVLELIQNAEDAGMDVEESGWLKILLSEKRLKIIHNGAPFTAQDAKAICSVDSPKRPARGTLGYLGLGFKSVFRITDAPEIYSGGFRFRFDRNAFTDVSHFPWQVMPFWIEEPSEPIDTELTTFCFPLRSNITHELLWTEIEKLSLQLYLFLRWLRKIEIKDETTGQTKVLEDLGEDENGIETLSMDGKKQDFKVFRKTIVVPEVVKNDRLVQDYRANVNERDILIAFPLDNQGNLIPAEKGAMFGGVYSFMPLGEASSGAKFPIKADFLVQPGRDAISYESSWNHWLMQEVADLCIEAIKCFKEHLTWRYQFLPLFEFEKRAGQAAYENLFGPKLITVVERFIEEDNCMPTKDGGWAKPGQVVRLTETAESGKALVLMDILKPEEIAPAFGAHDGLFLVHEKVQEETSNPKRHVRIKDVNRINFLENKDFLTKRAEEPGAAAWFRSIYLFLKNYPLKLPYGPKQVKHELQYYHKYEIMLTQQNQLLKGGNVYVPDFPSDNPIVAEHADLVENKNKLLHPDILKIDSKYEYESLRGFLRGYMGLQIFDIKKLCKDVVLPKILATSQKSSPEELIKNTIYCRRTLGGEIPWGVEIWMVTKENEIRKSKEVLLPTELRPAINWEINKEYIAGIHFISKRYFEVVENLKDEDIAEWRKFFIACGVKDTPDNGVEEFAMNYADKKLKERYKDITWVENRNLGYDIEADNETGGRVRVEVKGRDKDGDIELTSNETEAADQFPDDYYLCVVSGIPEHPEMFMVPDPVRKGKKEKLTVPMSTWKQYRYP